MPTVYQAQSNCAKSFSYVVTEKHQTTISAESNLEDLTNYEISLSRPYQIGIGYDYCIDQSGSMTLTVEDFGNKPIDSWMTRSSKTVTNSNSVKIFDEDGELLSESPTQSEILTPLSQEEIASFGVEQPFVFYDQSEAQELSEEGIELLILEDGRFYLGADDYEVIYDEANLQVIYNEVSEGLITEQSIETYIPQGSGYLKMSEENYEYRQMPSGNLLRIETLRTFFDYTMDGAEMLPSQDLRSSQDQGSFSNSISTESFTKFDRELNFSMRITPNPATDWVSIFVPNLGRYVTGTIRIFDMNGKSVKTLENVNAGEESTVSVEELSPGVYVVQSVVGEQIFSKSLIISNTH